MGLLNDGNYFNFYNLNEQNSLTLFAEAERRMKSKKEAIKDMENEYRLLEQDAFNLYKSHVNYYHLFPDIITKAQDWLSMIKNKKDKDGNKLDGRKNYDEKACFNILKEKMKEFLGVEIEITCIMNYNFGEAWDVYFEAQGHKWELKIPIIKGVGLKSYQYYGDSCFKLKLGNCDKDHVCEYVGSTFKEEDLKDIMAEGIKKYS